MKYFNKSTIFLVIMLFSYGADAFGYTFTLTNQTGRDVKIQLHWAVGKLGHSRIIKAGDRHKFSFTFPDPRFGLCLASITVWTKNSAGKWWRPAKAKKKFLRKDGTEITGGSLADLHSGLVRGGWSTLSMCKSKKFILRMNPKNREISAIIQTNY